MSRKHFAWLVISPLLFVALTTAALGWTTVGVGIEFQQFTVSGPNNVFVTRMARSNQSAFIESCLANGRLSGGYEIVRSQAARLDDAINYWGQIWGQRNDVIVAINGDFVDTETQTPLSGQVLSGWYAKRFWDAGGDSGFAWQIDRDAFMGECVHHIAGKQTVTYTSNGDVQNIKGINTARGDGDLYIYTPQYDTTTKTSNSGHEVVVQLNRPMVIIPSPNKVVGIVKEVRQNAGSTPIPFDCIVLSATGNVGNAMLQGAVVGSEIWISQEITNCSAGGPDWTKTYASIGSNYNFLKAGVVYSGGTDLGLTQRHPRTAIALNATYIFFIVCDGRDPGVSVGMTMTEIGNFCKNTLGATDGVNQDGGGSSTMLVNGTVMNSPSDGSERPVANGMMMVNVLPKVQSTTYSAGSAVHATQTAALRMGPGTNYGFVNTMWSNAEGTIANHALNGVLAKGQNWWLVDFGSGKVGWVEQNAIAAGGTDPPVVTSHPAPVTACPGTPANFSVSATGEPTLLYQWQKNGSNLANGGHYSNVTTPILTVSGIDAGDVGEYRCRVSNAYGTVYSNAAALSLDVTPPTAVTVTDAGDWTPSVSTLSASWTASAASCNRTIDRYEYAVGTSANTQDIRVWTSAGLALSMVDSTLSLSEGQKYWVQVRPVDSGGIIGAADADDNGITVAPAAATIAAALAVPNDQGLSLRNKEVTATFADGFYIEESDRSAAIKVVSDAGPGAPFVSAAGVLGMSGSQRALFADVVEQGTGSPAVTPLGMIGRSLGGDDFNTIPTPGVTGGLGLYSVGLLVRCWGAVGFSDSSNPLARFFYLDDGSGLSDGTHAGVRVECGSVAPPVSPTAAVTGIITTNSVGGRVVPVIRIRNSSDILPL